MATRDYRVVVGAIALAFLTTCAAEYAGDESEGVELHSASLKLRRECNNTKEEVYQRPGGNQGGALGDVVRCAKGGKLSIEQISAALSSRMFAGITPQKAVKLFRISYRTKRLGNQADLATALVALPARKDAANRQGMPEEDDDEEDKTKDGKRAPLVVFAHGTAPWGTACASSKLDPLQCSNTSDNDTELTTIVALATMGYPVIAPDYAGYVAGSRTPGYLLSEDEAHSVLDATRAMNKLRQRAVEKVVLLGHSQGGHAVLSAQALARSYGHAGQLVGVASMAGFWAPPRVLGLIAATGSGFETIPEAQAFIIEYFYTHAELLDGVGQGPALFAESKRSLLPGYINACSFTPERCTFINPPNLGLPEEFLAPGFYETVTACGFDNTLCDPVWGARFKADRPTLDRKGAPVVLWHGLNDAVLPVDFARCAHDKIAPDLAAKMTFCGDDDADHDTILSRDLAWITRWIDARALGGPEPETGPCKSYQDFLVARGITCPLPNVD